MSEPKKKYKFSFHLDPSTCMACAACEWECRDGGIFIDDSVNYAINQENCTRCGRCFRACPTGSISRISHQ